MFKWLLGGGDDGSSDKNKNNTPPSSADQPKVNLSSGADAEVELPAKPDLFDPSILERVAKAAESLKNNEHAQDLMTLAREQEKSWQEKFNAIRAEAMTKQKELETEQLRVAENERRRTMQFETEQQQQRAQYQDQLARKRYQDQLGEQRQLNERERQAQEASVMRQEQERRRTVEYEAELRRQTELEKARVESEYRTRQERENRDIRDAQLVLQAEQNRITVLEAIRQAGQTVGDGFKDFTSDPQKMGATVGVVTALALGVYAARSSANVAGQYVMQRLSKPPLVRETSRKPFLLHPVQSLKKAFFKPKSNPLEGIILNEDAQRRLQSITLSTARTRRHRATFRNLMLWGPPGTGKTMFARRLAQQSGLEYAVLAGGDVGPLGKDAVTEIHKVFDWAERSKRGVLVFIDEADAFLRKRGVEGDGRMTEETRNALSTFLYRTGDPSQKFMLVFSTNEPQTFDRAVTDRVDEVVELALPGLKERRQLLDQYFEEHVLKSGERGATPIVLADDVTNFDWDSLTKELEGFSGRQISKLANAWQAAAHASANNTLTADMMRDIAHDHKEQLKIKDQWAHAPLPRA